MRIEIGVLGLLVLAGLLFCGLYEIRYRMVRVYNWDGSRYRLLGYLRLKKAGSVHLDFMERNDTYVIKMTERMWDISYTTRYLLLPSKQLARQKKTAGLLLQAGSETVWMAMESRLRCDIYYR